MCGIVIVGGEGASPNRLGAAMRRLHHRGPDATGTFVNPGVISMGHTRLSIIDVSDAGNQPMTSGDGRFTLVANGEIYNYRELRRELPDRAYHSQSDSEVLLAAYETWGEACLDRLLGMFAFAVWDAKERELFIARDRFGVKPLYYSYDGPRGTLVAASEIKALHDAGVPRAPNLATWSAYLGTGHYGRPDTTFWDSVSALPAGHSLRWRPGDAPIVSRWYSIEERARENQSERTDDDVIEEYTELLKDSVALRFRADVPVGINLSGGVDSSTLLGLVRKLKGDSSGVTAFTFVTGDSRYDELPWVSEMLRHTNYPLNQVLLRAADVPQLAQTVQDTQDEPYGGIPTLAYAKIFAEARAQGVLVLLDGQGIDEQWAGYDYYQRAGIGRSTSTVQGTKESPVRPACLRREFAARAATAAVTPPHNPDPLVALQLRDILQTKLPRALRFNDRISMMSSVELREPFLDHRLFELALPQPRRRKIADGRGKHLFRSLASSVVPESVVEAPKRALQTPQREWLRGPLRPWVQAHLDEVTSRYTDWFDGPSLQREWDRFCSGGSDNSFYVWQWVSVSLMNL